MVSDRRPPFADCLAIFRKKDRRVRRTVQADLWERYDRPDGDTGRKGAYRGGDQVGFR